MKTISVSINEYGRDYLDDGVATRLILYPNADVAAKSHELYQSANAVLIGVSDVFNDGLELLPTIDDVLQQLDERIRAEAPRRVVVEFDAYLSLLDEQRADEFLSGVISRVKKHQLNVCYLTSRCSAQVAMKTSSKPQLAEARQIVELTGDAASSPSATVRVIAAEFLPPRYKNCAEADWRSVLRRLEAFFRRQNIDGADVCEGAFYLAPPSQPKRQAGLSSNVEFFLDVPKIARELWDIHYNASATVLCELMKRCVKRDASPTETLENSFGAENLAPTKAVKRFKELAYDPLWPVYVAFVKERIDADSYLRNVLEIEGLKPDAWLSVYFDVAARTVSTNAERARKFAQERFAAFQTLNDVAESCVAQFVGQTREYGDAILPWLNCGTEAERQELIRRAGVCGWADAAPPILATLFPTLADYLSNDFDFGDDALNLYFKDYRRQKIVGSVEPEFPRRALETQIPATISHRTAALAREKYNASTALLVVDGMGAEYFPLLLAAARSRQNTEVKSAQIVTVSLPTSTERNPIDWPRERRLPDVKTLDVVAHDGAVKHESNTPERNISASLQVFEKQIFNAVADTLSKFERVVVTADHGTSRLTVLAHNAGLDETLAWPEDADAIADWRFAVAPPDLPAPEKVESVYCADKNINYWCVKGYDRFPKKGPKFNEAHGGASLEERLVPFVVFTRRQNDAATVAQPQIDKARRHQDTQIVENPDFDDF
ncbi:MAG: BREX-4 system phosphatase PglZ [Thermoguttaceae bacterium]|nr:BREX-4 system phosphatase PglZ [Thermoguttaceae bacterium]